MTCSYKCTRPQVVVLKLAWRCLWGCWPASNFLSIMQPPFLQVEVLKLSWRCPWECWPAILALRELHLVGRGPGGQFDFTTLDLESALACHGLEAIVIHSDNIFLRTRAPCSFSHLGSLVVLGLLVCYPAYTFSERGKLHKPLNTFSAEFKLDPNVSRSNRYRCKLWAREAERISTGHRQSTRPVTV